MSYREWFVGMKVVCIKRGAWTSTTPNERGFIAPLYGAIYTIREFEKDWFGVMHIRLVEIINSPASGFGIEPAFNICRFRPVQPRKTDISWATSMLTGAKERERA